MHMRIGLNPCHRILCHLWKFPHGRKQTPSVTTFASTVFLSSKVTEPIDWLEVQWKAKTTKMNKLKSYDYSMEPGLDRSMEYFTKEYGLDDPDRAALQPVEDFLRYIFSDHHARENREVRETFLLVGDGSIPIRKLLQDPEMIDMGVVLPQLITKVVQDYCSEMLEVTPDGRAVRRIIPFEIENLYENAPETLIVWNIPRDELLGEYLVTKEQLNSLFLGDIHYTTFRFRSPTPNDRVKRGRIPTGVASIEFRTAEDCRKNAELYLTYHQGKSVPPKKELCLQENILQVSRLDGSRNIRDCDIE